MSAGESRDALAVRMGSSRAGTLDADRYSYHRIAEGPGARARIARDDQPRAWPEHGPAPDGEQLLGTIIEAPVTSSGSRAMPNLEFVLRPLPDRDDDAAAAYRAAMKSFALLGIKSIYVLMIDYHLDS